MVVVCLFFNTGTIIKNIYLNLIISGSFMTVQRLYLLILIIIRTVSMPFMACGYEAQEWTIRLE